MVRIVQIAISFIWVGMLAGISFLEAPLKFRAPGITLGLGLGIGRLVFQALNMVEIAFAVILAATFLIARRERGLPFYLFLGVAVLLGLQTFWLLPALDVRAEMVIQGDTPPGSNEHIFYIVFEIVKLLTLLVIGIAVSKRSVNSQQVFL